MNKPLAKPMQMVEVGPLGERLKTGNQTTLVKTASVEIIHLVVPAGETIPTHEAQGEMVLHCLEGKVKLAATEHDYELNAGQLLYLVVNKPFSIEGLEDASLLATIILPHKGGGVELIGNSKLAFAK